jgi:hypothetical protein
LWLAGTAAALVLYVLTLAPGPVWQDAGDYQRAAAQLELSRPGDAVRVHPWFIVTAHALGMPGLCSPAYAANLASAMGAALAVGNILLLIRLVTGRTWPAVIGAAAFGLGHTIWSFAVIAQTYGWVAALLSTELLCVWAFLSTRQARWLLALAVVDGVAISNHLMASLGMAVLAVWVIWECLRRRAPWWVLPAGAACWVVGGALYWYVFVQEWQRTGSLAAAIHSATVGGWGSEVFNFSALPAMAGRTVLYVGLNYPTPLILGIFLGGAVLVARRDTFSRLLVILAALYFFWAARYRVVDPSGFFVPFYVVAGVMIGVAVDRWLRPAAGASPSWRLGLALAAALMPVGVYAVLPCLARPVLEQAGVNLFPRALPYRDSYAYFLRPWKQGNDGAQRFAEETLDALPPGAILVTDGTPGAPLAYVQEVEGRGRHVILLGAGPRLSAEARRLVEERKQRLTQGLEDEPGIFVVSNLPDYVPPWVREHAILVPFGSIWKAEPRGKEADP